jgi:Arc/MetJ family transcription regulator
MNMKRTNLVLDADLLNKATQALGLKTYSATVNHALAQALRVRKIQGLQAFFGSGLWEGSLAEMREDRVAPRKERTGGRQRRPR